MPYALAVSDEHGQARDADLDRFDQLGRELAAAIDRCVVGWWLRCLSRFGVGADEATLARFGGAAVQLAEELAALLALPPEAQPDTPLQVLRRSVSVPTAELDRAGAEAPPRDAFDRRAFPLDRFALTPSSFADVDPSLVEPGLTWGAAKAYLHLVGRGGSIAQPPR